MQSRELKPGQWIIHRGFAWKISEAKAEAAGEWDMVLILHRDDLELKEKLAKIDEWHPGRTTVTSILRVKSNEFFELCADDVRQFPWIKRS